MAGTDFFDEDLSGRGTSKRQVADVVSVDAATDLKRPVSDLNLTRLARHREELDSQVAESVQELDLLRARKDEVERKRRELEEQRSKQDSYETSKRELMDRVNQSLIMIEKEEIRTDRLLEVLRSSRSQLRAMLDEVESLNEETWPDDQIRDQLNRSLVILDESRIEYNKTIAKIEMVMGDSSGDTSDQPGLLFRDSGSSAKNEGSFGYWFRAGLAASLPLMVFGIVATIVFLVLKSRGLI